MKTHGEKTDSVGKLPDWLHDLFREFVDSEKHRVDLLSICIRGITSLKGTPRLLEALPMAYRALGEDPADHLSEEQVADAERAAALATSEIAKGFPLLTQQFTISLWSSLERFARDIAAGWLGQYPQSRQIEVLSRVRIPVPDLEKLDEAEKWHYVVDLLEDAIQSRRAPGPKRFEKLLGVFGFNLELCDDQRLTLIELHYVRNMLVHNHSRCDRHVQTRCPWLNLQANEAIMVGKSAFLGYSATVIRFATVMVLEGSRLARISRESHVRDDQ